MENEVSQSSEGLDLRAQKFTQAGYGFLVLNVAYLAIAMMFIPPFNLGLSAILSLVAFLLLMGVLTYYLLKGKKRLAQVLAVIYGARSIFAALPSVHVLSGSGGQDGIGPDHSAWGQLAAGATAQGLVEPR